MIKAFTMLESLLVLGLVSILALGLSGSVQSTFAAVEEQIFFMEFEELYRETQKRSVASQQKTNLNLDGQTLSNGGQKLTVPKGIQAPSG
ncbi:competence protein [Streptococcus pneumoniae]|nr:competence protein [Streptococcus pneumoniae]